jgi:hypothetical protein
LQAKKADAPLFQERISVIPPETAEEIGFSLEENFQGQSQLARIARKYCARLVERGVRGFQDRTFRTSESEWLDIIQLAPDVLRVVEEIRCGSAEFDLDSLRYTKTLQSGHIDVIDGLQLQCVTTDGRQCTIARLNILSVWI